MAAARRPSSLQDEPAQEVRLGVVLVARRVLVTEAVEDGLQRVEREVEAAVAVVIARDGHHRRAVVGVLLQRLLRERCAEPVSRWIDLTSASAAMTPADLGIWPRFCCRNDSASVSLPLLAT